MDAKGARALVERLALEGRVYDETSTSETELALTGDALPADHPADAEPAPRQGAERAA
jgi:hypothetical protein